RDNTFAPNRASSGRGKKGAHTFARTRQNSYQIAGQGCIGFLVRIFKELGLSDRQLVHGSNLLYWRLASGLPPGLDQQDPELTGNKRCIDQHEKCDELTSRTVLVLRPIEGKTPPLGVQRRTFFPTPNLARCRTTRVERCIVLSTKI